MTKTTTDLGTVAEEIDEEALKLDTNDCEFSIENDEIKILE